MQPQQTSDPAQKYSLTHPDPESHIRQINWYGKWALVILVVGEASEEWHR